MVISQWHTLVARILAVIRSHPYCVHGYSSHFFALLPPLDLLQFYIRSKHHIYSWIWLKARWTPFRRELRKAFFATFFYICITALQRQFWILANQTIYGSRLLTQTMSQKARTLAWVDTKDVFVFFFGNFTITSTLLGAGTRTSGRWRIYGMQPRRTLAIPPLFLWKTKKSLRKTWTGRLLPPWKGLRDKMVESVAHEHADIKNEEECVQDQRSKMIWWWWI